MAGIGFRSTGGAFTSLSVRWFLVLGALSVLSVVGAAGAQQAKPPASKSGSASAARSAQAELDALIKAAKAEGELTFYSASVTAPIAAKAFSTKYGIKTQYVRLASTQIQQRYAAEAEAGSFPADVMIDAGSAFAEQGIQKGWVELIVQAGIPALRSGEFPQKFIKGPTAVVQVTPFYVPYNTNLVKKGELPKDWPDILDPKINCPASTSLPSPGRPRAASRS